MWEATTGPNMHSAFRWNTNNLNLLQGGEQEAGNLKSKDRIGVVRTLNFFSHSSFVILNSETGCDWATS